MAEIEALDHEMLTLIPAELYKSLQKKLQPESAESIRIRVVECLKYLLLASAGGIGPIPISRTIDDVWHQLILETREYRAVCHRLGGDFLHHTSLGLSDAPVTMSACLEFGFGWLASYVQSFGPVPADRLQYWPAIGAIGQLLNCNHSTLNSIGLELKHRVRSSIVREPVFDCP